MKIQNQLLAASLTIAIFLSASRAAQAQDLRITEAMSSSGGTVDWFELTNYGLTMASITGWRMDDNSYVFANSVLLNGVTSINPGESVLFLESADGANIPTFRTFWGGIDSIQIGYYSGSGVGFSSAGDGVVVFDSLGAEQTPRATFGAAQTGSSFYFTYDAEGNSSAYLSEIGTLDGQVTFTAADALGNIGSPGTAARAIPEPGTGALLGLGAAWLLRRRRQT